MTSAFAIILLSAVITAALIIASAALSRRGSIFRLSFGLSYLMAMALMQPWRATSPEAFGMLAMTLGLLAIWVVLGCFIGAIPGAMSVSTARWLVRRFKRDA